MYTGGNCFLSGIKKKNSITKINFHTQCHFFLKVMRESGSSYIRNGPLFKYVPERILKSRLELFISRYVSRRKIFRQKTYSDYR